VSVPKTKNNLVNGTQDERRGCCARKMSNLLEIIKQIIIIKNEIINEI